MSALVLGPMLRHTDETSAAIWVETDAPCRVEVTAAGARHRAHTVTVHGHHYALVDEIERRSGSRAELPPVGELADFTDYTEIYRLAWSEEATRWLLSTVPTLMIFDDHDIRDDWNTSASWREKMAAQPWWRARIVGGLGSYWIYQHLGNLSGPERETDELWSALRAADGDAGDLLDAFATDADACPQRHRWSFARDIGRTRLIMLDSRATRVLEPGSRAIMDAEEWAWFDRQARTDGGQIDHVLIGTSLPYLLPIGVHDLEAWNEAVADGAWGARAARAAEAIRQGIDLEHWSAFHRSFDAMATAVTELATGARGRAPASIVFLSGDVHYSYRARAHLPVPHPGAVHQLVSSPMRNPLPRAVRWAHGVASFGVARLAGAAPELTVQARARLT